MVAAMVSAQRQFEVSTLANGLRLGTAELPGREAVSIGIWLPVGSRHEPEGMGGAAHFVEHMVFRGTDKRSARRITLDIEGVGGDINAFTSEDHTCYSVLVPVRHFRLAVDVLADLFTGAKMRDRDIEREREVIEEEILLYRENPGQHIDDLLSGALWPGHELGRPITGTKAGVGQLGRIELQQWIERYHHAGVVVAVAGPMAHAEVKSVVAAAFGGLPSGGVEPGKPFRKRRRAPKVVVEPRELEQAHVGLGFRGPGRKHPQRYAFHMLSVLLGESMGSRLFQTLREKRGDCYSVHSEVETFDEVGMLGIHAAIEVDRLPGAMRAIGKEFALLARVVPTKAEWRRALEFRAGQQAVWMESTANWMAWVGEGLLWYGRIPEPSESIAKLREVEPSAMPDFAASLLQPGHFGAALIGANVAPGTVVKWLWG